MNYSGALAAKRALQRQRVIRLYRASLKNLLSWAVFRDVFYVEANKLRDMFEANRHETNIERIDYLLAEGEKKLRENAHPDPYIMPYTPGGTKYARNPPVPEEIGIVYDFGKEEY